MAQLSLSLTILPDESAQGIIDAFCDQYGYSPANGSTQRQFIKGEIIEFLRLPYVTRRRQELGQQTTAALKAELDAITIA